MSTEGSADDRIKLVTQEALDGTVMAFHKGGETDVEGRLRAEMKRRGLEIEDEAWVTELAAKIRRGERVVVVGGPEDTPPADLAVADLAVADLAEADPSEMAPETAPTRRFWPSKRGKK